MAKGSIGSTLGVLDAQLALIAHLLQVLALFQRHSMCILEFAHLGKFEGVQAVALAVRSEVGGGRCSGKQ